MRASAAVELQGVAPREAQERWCDAALWPAFVEGLARVDEVGEGYPAAGTTVVWTSLPTGRGTVTERVVSLDPGAGLEVDVADPRLTGRQRVRFAEAPGAGTRVTLELDYRLRARGPLTRLTDALFIRRAQEDALRRTLLRFRAALEGQEPSPDGPAPPPGAAPDDAEAGP